jgi:molecular chaperone DnaK
MVKDAEAHAEEDKKRREVVEAKNQAEALMHSTERTLNEYGSKLSEADKSTIDTAMAELKTALEGDDSDKIKEKADALAKASMKLGEAMYQANQGGGDETGGDGGEAPESGEGVVDAEFEEVKDDENKKSA